VPGLLPGPLTPNYASPEQLRGLPVTTASDVYALGVLLYELVTGTRPYETTGQPLDRMIELVVRTEPPRPSGAAADPARPLPWDRRRLRGDLDAIVLKALAKDPDARYASAEQLAEDLGRFTTGLPVTAREPSAVYLLRKLASRHRVAAVLGGLAVAGVLAALGVALWQRHVAERERLRAEARFADVRALANTLIFKIHDAIVPLPGSTPVRKTIVAEALRYLKSLQQESETDLRLRFELAGAYQRIAFVLGYPQASNLGDRDGAIAALQQADRLIAGQALHPDAPLDTIDRYVSIQRQLSVLFKTAGRDAEARTAIAAALRRAEQLHAQDPRERRGRELLAHSLFDVAWGTADHRASLPVWRRAGALYEGLMAEQPADVNAMRNVALVEKYLGGRLQTLKEPAEALRHYQRALDLDEQRLARLPEDPQARMDTAIDLASVAAALEAGNDFARSIPLHVRSVEMRRALLRADPQNVWVRGRLGKALLELARVEARIGQPGAAIGHARESVATLRVTVTTTPDVFARSELGDALQVLASIEGLRGNRAESCRAYREAVAMFAGADRDRPTYRHLAEEGLRACGSS
jgi:eukaryotic-like serine/threonine-protein kinase